MIIKCRVTIIDSNMQDNAKHRV